MNKLIVLLAALLLAIPLAAKGVSNPDPASKAAPTISLINGTPLRVRVGSDNSYQIFNTTVSASAGQIYPTNSPGTADMGWFVRLGEQLYAPNFREHGVTATGSPGTPFNEVSMTAVTGTGTNTDPFAVTVSVTLGSTSFRAVKTITYVNGNNYFTERFRLINTGGTQQQASIYLGSDIYLANSDNGVPYREPTSGSPGGRTCAGVTPEYTILHIPLTPANRFTASQYASVWSQIGGGTLNNQVQQATCIDNGAALQWDVTVLPFGSRTILAATSFGDVPDITQFNIIEVNPGQGVVGTTLSVEISGYGFLPNTTFSFGNGITLSNLVVVSSNTATATLTIADNAPLGFRDVVATQTPGGIVATLTDGFLVTDPPIWNYSVDSIYVNPTALQCIRGKFHASLTSNEEGWAPSEGAWHTEYAPGEPIGPPSGLARAILDCYVSPFVWNADAGMLHSRYCWLNPYPLYDGDFPAIRFARLRIYDAVNEVCEGPQEGWPIYQGDVRLIRQLFYPVPLPRGFEDP